MQKVINVLAVLSFLGTASIIGGGVYVYTQKDAIIDGVRERITDELTKALPDMITGAVGGLGIGEDLAPELPVGSDSPIPSAPVPSLPF